MLKIRCLPRHGFLSQSGNHITHLSVVTLWWFHVAVMLKAVPSVFQIPAESPMVDRFQRSFQTRQTRKKNLATHFQKIGHENPMNSSGALFDTAQERERMEQKDQAGFCSAIHRVTRSQNQLNSTKNKIL